MTTEPKQRQIDSYEKMLERHQALLGFLDGARAAGLDPAACDLAAQLLDETFEQTENVMAVAWIAAEGHKALSEENTELAGVNEFLFTSLMDGKTFQFKKA